MIARRLQRCLCAVGIAVDHKQSYLVAVLNAVSVARVIVVLMSIGIRTVGLAGSGGLGTSDPPPSPPAEQADNKTQTTAIYKYFFISIDLKLQ